MPVWFNIIEYSFGLFRRSVEEMIYLEQQIDEYKATRKEGIFVLFVGVTNHWVAFIVHKKAWNEKPPYTQDKYKAGSKLMNKYYLLDCSNIKHLDKMEEDIPGLIMERLNQNIKIGLKAVDKFQVEMNIQSLYDLRFCMAKLIHSFNNDGLCTRDHEKLGMPTLTKFYTSTHINNMLRHF